MTLLLLTFGNSPRRYSISSSSLIGLGLGCAAGAGVLGLLAGKAFLSGLWWFPAGLPLGSPLLFDVGVFLTVFGAAMHMLKQLTGAQH
jgi:multicomponent Na+:H+ antiporter subunit A